MTSKQSSQWFRFCPNCKNHLKVDGNKVECLACNFLHYLNPAPAVTVVVEKDDQVLLARRGIEPRLGTWDLPGGFVNAGEAFEDTVLREVKEETGLEVEIVQNLGSTPDVYGATDKPTINSIYLVKIISGSAQAADDVAELKWFTKSNLPKTFAFHNSKIALDRYQEYKRQA